MCLPANFIISYEIPTSKGRKRRWIKSLSNFMEGNPHILNRKVSRKAKKIMATIRTTKMKDVPQRGCFVE